MTDEQVRLPSAVAARYRAARVLGTGGMSTVYAARDTLLHRDVAVKVFTANASDQKDLRAQQAEARLAASMNHHALTTVFDAGVDTSDPAAPQIYLVMEFIPGADLRERLRGGALEVDQVCWLGFDLADALDYVHDAGFVHHDIKPANVLLATRNATSRLRGKLTDFGIATIIGERDENEFTTGTAAYLSPEQVEGRDAEPASDVYSLGLVLLEALTGRVAFPGSVQQSAFGRLERDPEIPDFLPRPVAALLREMTAREPSARPTPRRVADRFQTIVVDRLLEREEAELRPADEALRQQAVDRYAILDTPADDAFDAVTRLAAKMLHVPIALVTIVDRDRVWFKSKRGVDLTEVDRNTAFCSTTNPGGDGAWTIPDALADPRLQGNELVVSGPQVRSYAAAPLITWDGHHLGALCVFDTQPREFLDDELEDLTDLAGLIMRELELRLASRRAVFDR